MAERTGIAWARSTFNPWIGCTEVSTEENGGGGCDGCYARELDKRHRWGGATHWGAGVPRMRTSAAYWRQPLRWNEWAAEERTTGVVKQRPGQESWTGPVGFWPVFPSMCDPFDNEVADEWHADLWRLIRSTPNLTYLLLTKRVGNVEKMHPGGEYPNVWIGASMVNQKEVDRDMPKLLAVNGFAKRFISYEPALGPVQWPGFGAGSSWCPICKAIVKDSLLEFHENHHGASLMDAFDPQRHTASVYDMVHQIIVGGESNQGKHRARPFDIENARSTVRQCRAAGVAPFVKQLGARPGYFVGQIWCDMKLKDRAGADPAEWSEDLRVQEFPR